MKISKFIGKNFKWIFRTVVSKYKLTQTELFPKYLKCQQLWHILETHNILWPINVTSSQRDKSLMWIFYLILHFKTFSILRRGIKVHVIRRTGHKKNNSCWVCKHTWRCGHAASRVGSSSSGSNSAPLGFEDGGRVRKRLTANCWVQKSIEYGIDEQPLTTNANKFTAWTLITFFYFMAFLKFLAYIWWLLRRRKLDCLEISPLTFDKLLTNFKTYDMWICIAREHAKHYD